MNIFIILFIYDLSLDESMLSFFVFNIRKKGLYTNSVKSFTQLFNYNSLYMVSLLTFKIIILQ